MKIRTDFVTNSSSSSFVCVALFDKELRDLLLKLRKEERAFTSEAKNMFWETVTIFEDNRDCVEITDIGSKLNCTEAYESLEKHFDNVSDEEKSRIFELIEDIYKSKTYRSKSFISETDGYGDMDSFDGEPTLGILKKLKSKKPKQAPIDEDYSNCTKKKVWVLEQEGFDENTYNLSRRSSYVHTITKDGTVHLKYNYEDKSIVENEVIESDVAMCFEAFYNDLPYCDRRYFFLKKDHSVVVKLMKKSGRAVNKQKQRADFVDGARNVKDFYPGKYIHYIDGSVELYGDEFNNKKEFASALKKHGNNPKVIHKYYDNYLLEYENNVFVPVGKNITKTVKGIKNILGIKYFFKDNYFHMDIPLIEIDENVYKDFDGGIIYGIKNRRKLVNYEILTLVDNGSVLIGSGIREKIFQDSSNPVKEMESIINYKIYEGDDYEDISEDNIILLFENGDLTINGELIERNVKHIELDFKTLYAYI